MGETPSTDCQTSAILCSISLRGSTKTLFNSGLLCEGDAVFSGSCGTEFDRRDERLRSRVETTTCNRVASKLRIRSKTSTASAVERATASLWLRRCSKSADTVAL